MEGAETCLVCQTFAHSSRGVGPQGTWVVKAGWLLSYTTSHVKMFFLSAASDTFFKTQIASLHSYLNPFHGQAGRRGAKDDHLPKAQRQAPGSEGQECGKSRARQKSEGPTPPSQGGAAGEPTLRGRRRVRQSSPMRGAHLEGSCLRNSVVDRSEGTAWKYNDQKAGREGLPLPPRQHTNSSSSREKKKSKDTDFSEAAGEMAEKRVCANDSGRELSPRTERDVLLTHA